MANIEFSRPIAVDVRSYHGMLAQFPVVCFTLTLFTDLAYWRSANLMWLNFSSWLLFAGLVFGGLTIIVGVVEWIVPSARAMKPDWPYAIGGVAVLLLALINSLVHAGDGWTAVVPWGLALSAVTVIAMCAIALMVHPRFRVYARGEIHNV